MINTCKGCSCREPGCHDRCNAYQTAKQEHDKASAWLRWQNQVFLMPPNIYYRKSALPGEHWTSRR